jgi:lipase
VNGPRFLDVNGVRLALWERPGHGRPILFAHATGFHARCWNQIIARIPSRPCYALDMRGHGLSSKSEPPYLWSRFGEDVAAVARLLGLRGITGAGHSMGGHSLALAAILAPAVFDDMLLIDPVIMPQSHYTGPAREPHFARKRRNTWQSAQEMFDRFRDRPPFRYWDEAVLRDYCEFGLEPAPSGDGFVLTCPPEVEGSIYENSGQPDADLYPRLGEVDARVTLIRARQLMPQGGPAFMAASPTAPDLAACFRHAHDIEVAGSHFIPMEAPQLIAEHLAET